MKKGKFIALILITALGLSGIVALQAYWLRQAWRLKEEEFDTAVMNSLDNVSQKVAQRQVIRILGEIPHFSATVPTSAFHPSAPDARYRRIEVSSTDRADKEFENQQRIADSLSIVVDNMAEVKINHITEERTVTLKQQTVGLENALLSLESNLDKLAGIQRQMQGKLNLALGRLNDIQTDSLAKLDAFMQHVQDTLTGSGIIKPVRMIENIVSEVIIRMDTEDAGLQQNISQEDLRAILQEELSQKKISMPFKYSVYSQTKKKDVLFSDSTDTSQLHASPYKIYLSGSEGNFDELSVYFPDKRNYMLQSMAGIIGISGLLSLLAITGFIWLARMLSRQQKISAMKTQFINNMTHEFKTPLATTLVAASSLNNPKIYSDPEKIGYYTNLIKEENRLMNRQIETVLQAALLDKDKLLLKSEPLDLREIVQKAVEGLQFQIEQAKGTIRLSLQEQPAIISGDADHLQQVIANLVMNSLKYSERTPEIEIALNSSGKKYFLQVCDNGIGISRKDQKYIFDAFYRVNTGDVHTIKGFGLGLNYVKKIVEYHKGKITVESEPGKGSVFTLTFQRYE